MWPVVFGPLDAHRLVFETSTAILKWVVYIMRSTSPRY